MKKKATRSRFCALLLVTLLMTNFVATHVTAGAVIATQDEILLKYIGVNALSTSLSISSTGETACLGRLDLNSGYEALLTVELKQGNTTIRTWTDYGDGGMDERITVTGSYSAMSGYTYTVTATANIYNSNGDFVESVSKSESMYY